MHQAETTPLSLHARVESLPLRQPFHISGHTMHVVEVLVVELEADGYRGCGEAAGVFYLNDDVPHMLRQVETVRSRIEAGVDQASLQHLLPAGGARNAIDCALWELQARRATCPVWSLLGMRQPQPVMTTFTVGADRPEKMAADAVAHAQAKAIKLKLIGDETDGERVRAVRDARSDVWLGVDANRGLNRAGLERLVPALLAADVQLIEQPFPVGCDAWLDGLLLPIAVAADESVQTLNDMPRLAGRYSVVNLKLDKCGGLTAAMQMVTAARELGLDLMVGNMIGTSLAMAPAFLVAQHCRIVDLDGPLFLERDRAPGVSYQDGFLHCPADVWGGVMPQAQAQSFSFR